MSYILEALRRAESERTRGQVPGLDAQGLALAGDDERPPRRRGPWLLAAASLAVLGLGGAVWWSMRPVPPAPLASVPMPVALPSTPASAPTPTSTTALAAALPAAPVAPALPAAPVAPALAAVPASPPTRAPKASPPPAAVPPEAAPPSAKTPPASTVPPLASTPPASTPVRPAPVVQPPPPAGPPTQPALAVQPVQPVPAAPPAPPPIRLADLSPQQRAGLPPMAIGGAIYSDSAAARFILVNGQVVREGDAPAPGVVLERIGPRAAVLRWRDLRIEVPY